LNKKKKAGNPLKLRQIKRRKLTKTKKWFLLLAQTTRSLKRPILILILRFWWIISSKIICHKVLDYKINWEAYCLCFSMASNNLTSSKCKGLCKLWEELQLLLLFRDNLCLVISRLCSSAIFLMGNIFKEFWIIRSKICNNLSEINSLMVYKIIKICLWVKIIRQNNLLEINLSLMEIKTRWLATLLFLNILPHLHKLEYNHYLLYPCLLWTKLDKMWLEII
jgi:hypothetical protein